MVTQAAGLPAQRFSTPHGHLIAPPQTQVPPKTQVQKERGLDARGRLDLTPVPLTGPGRRHRQPALPLRTAPGGVNRHPAALSGGRLCR